MFFNVRREHIDALLGCEVDHLNAFFSQPIKSTAKVNGFANDHHADSELQNKTAAIPAGREGSNHYLVTIGTLSPCLAESICLPMHRWIVLLNAAIVTGTK